MLVLAFASFVLGFATGLIATVLPLVFLSGLFLAIGLVLDHSIRIAFVCVIALQAGYGMAGLYSWLLRSRRGLGKRRTPDSPG